MTVITRFAPSPTGYLHIGSLRTALFNWLFARHHGGQFLLRVEDTDRERSTPEAVTAILSGLTWMGLSWDGEAIFQYERAKRHQEIAHALVAKGAAYYCYTSPEELATLREAARAENKSFRYHSPWRDSALAPPPSDLPPVVRLKTPLEGDTVLQDLIQGEIKIANNQLDDMILLRSDGSPTYLLAVVVDDFDMAISHVIRGDDHLTNTFRQIMIYQAMGWDLPHFAHIPLIHGPDGAKLSKRHGALGVDAYKEMGFLPEALFNYLLRLGWSHGDDEIISIDEAISWFSLEHVGRSPSRFDMAKLSHLNAHYLAKTPESHLLSLLTPPLENIKKSPLSSLEIMRLTKGLPSLKTRAKTLCDLEVSSTLYLDDAPFTYDEKGQSFLTCSTSETLEKLLRTLEEATKSVPTPWSHTDYEREIKAFCHSQDILLKDIAQPLRFLLTGSLVSPSLFELMEILGLEEVRKRLQKDFS